MLRSIRTRLMLSHLAVIVAAMVLSGFLLLSLLQRYFLEAMEQSLIAQAHITAQTLIPGGMAAGPVAEEQAAVNTVWQQRVDNLSLQAQNVAPRAETLPEGAVDLSRLSDASLELSSQLDTRIRVLDSRGVVLVDSQQTSRGDDLHSEPLVVQALEGQTASRTDWSGRERPSMHLALPVLVEGRIAGAVYLSQPLDDVAAVLGDLRTRWLLSMAIGLLLSGIVGWGLSQAIARPLLRLTHAAGAVARGDLAQQVPVSSGDELGRLSRAFNEMTARLSAARQVQTDFVANVSHELRTPLTSVKGFIETLRAGAVDDRQVRDEFLLTLERETDRLIRLVNDLLLLSKADSAALDLQRAPVDIVELAQATVDRLRAQAETRQVSLVVQSDLRPRLALADEDRVEQVLLNLLDNAIKFSPPGGRVTIDIAAAPEKGVQVRVCDRGIGIAAENLARIGERFYRADKARTRAQGGSGLGLAIARALVEAHGGELAIESQEDRGTTVSFTLPSPGAKA